MKRNKKNVKKINKRVVAPHKKTINQMSCNSCKDISFDKRPTYAEILEAQHLDFYYEEFEGEMTDDPNFETGDNLIAVIHCYECGTTQKANGEVIKGGPTKDDVEDYDKQYDLDDFKITKVESYDFSKKEVRDKFDEENQNKDD